MPRVKRGTIAQKRRRNLLAQAKGFRFGRSKEEREAKVAVTKAGAYARAHRRAKKNDFRRLWQIQIGAAVRPFDLSYSRFMDLLKKKGILLDRKILATLAQEEPATFQRVVESVK